VLSSKVGRLILDEVETGSRDFGDKGGLFESGRPNRVVKVRVSSKGLEDVTESYSSLL
jgi:D-threo-aldose 1-dehydrogenase